ncbi:hypothetical protein AMAG_14681 [Allomyces macrogynus ATCC 38327]|uniref:Uncharacterized protein n=1 Tax=Allomyces macrogynus (strain ATCC 38327) TaxID=578462 RepID=A0A0L0T7N3_ALLM3|nr:hypothetical protein AMAG_14681 [Allomyces macrogynus ATCC 38327]|eukprot:KNE70559.1 hypothetical protein AMAG_14681 [Allomyces macrogynus ATCC 38327]
MTTSGMPDMNPGVWADQYPLAPLALWDGRATSHVDVAPPPAVLATTAATTAPDSVWPTAAKIHDSRPLGPVLALETAMFHHHHHPAHEPMLDAPSSSTAHLAVTSPTDLAPSALDELAAAMAVSTPTTPGVTRQLSSLSLHSRPLASTVSSLSLDTMGASVGDPNPVPLARIASGGGASLYGFLHDSGLNLGDTPTLAAVDPMGVVAGAAQDRLHARRAAGAPEPLRLIDVRDTARFQESPLPTPSMGLPDATTGPLSPAAPDSGIMPSATAVGVGGNLALPLASQSPPPSSGLDSWWLAAASTSAALAALAPPPPPAVTMPVFGDGGVQLVFGDGGVPLTAARPRALTVHELPVPPMTGLFSPVQTQHPLELQRRRAASMLLPVSATLANSAGMANVTPSMAPTFSSFDVSSPTIPPTAAFHHTGVATVPLSPAWPLSPPPTGLPQAPTTPTPTTPGFPPGAGPSTPPSSGSQRVAGPRRRRRSSLAPIIAAAMDDWPSVPVSLPHVAEHSVVDPADIFAPPPPAPVVSSPPTSTRAKVRPRSRCLSMPSASSAPLAPPLLATGTAEHAFPAPPPPAASPPAPVPTTPTATTLVFASGLRGGIKGKRARHSDGSDVASTANAASAAAAPQATKRQRSKSLTALHAAPPALPRSCPACLLPEGTLMRSSRDLCAACIEKRQRAIDVANAAYQEQYAGVDAECASCHEVKPVLEGFHRLGKVARKICKVCDYRAQKERGMRRKAVMLEGAAASAAASAVAAMAAAAAAGDMDPDEGVLVGEVVSPRPTKSRKSGSGKKSTGRRRSSAAAALTAVADTPSTTSSSLFSTSTATTDTPMSIDLPDAPAPLFTLAPLQPPPPPPPMARRNSSMASVLLSTGHAPGTVPDEFLLASAADAALATARAEDTGAGAAPTMFTTDPMHELHKYVLGGGSTAGSLLPEDLNAELQGVLATGDEMAGIWDASGAPRRASAEPRTGRGE